MGAKKIDLINSLSAITFANSLIQIRSDLDANCLTQLCDTLMLILKDFFEKVNFEEKISRPKKHEEIPSMQSYVDGSNKFSNICRKYRSASNRQHGSYCGRRHRHHHNTRRHHYSRLLLVNILICSYFQTF